ncbi:ATP-grasp domain-containing protein (plasmid) [Pontibacillus sp. ALD_SL1]|uniref:ATP-grasp domain-containing protein n=1 Tax=Pontibacillus sp. ALD_SL1 TaxID=2777185 RepID=UPI001A96AD61|nr:ATP-grasp domain-containing protein [Pontibacillus sp. ALD_SL1]QST02101.1 ATP-grasp domain-containing protein [Pontibacillus sp. ALD_SL1]
MCTNVLLTGGRAPATLELARMFGKQGHEVHVADSFSYSISRYSKYVTFHEIRSPRQDESQYIEDLNNIIDENGISLLVPTCEEIFYIAKHKDVFPSSCVVFTEEIEVLETLHRKDRFIQLVKQLGYAAPETHSVSDVRGWESFFQKRKKEEWVAKPVYSRFSNGTCFSADFPEAVERLKRGVPYVIQALVKGKQYCTYSISVDGELLAHTQYEALHRGKGGASVAFKHEERRELERWVRSFVRKMRFTGSIAFDFILTEEGGWLPIECNPRVTSGIHLFRGCFLPGLFSQEKERVFPCKEGFMISALCLWNEGKRILTLNQKMPPYPKGYKDIFFDQEDPGPFLYQGISLYGWRREAKRLGVSITEASTYDIQWDGEGQ